MNAADFRYGFRIVGKTCEPRRLVDAGAAFAAYAAADPKAECDKESYLSAFWFAADFADYLKATGSTAGFSGPCWSPLISFDIDAEGDLERAQAEAEALVEVLTKRYGIDAAGLLLFCSGSKGFHVGLPTGLWSPSPSADFHRMARRFAEHVAELAGVTIDAGIYDRVRPFRAPNSRHPKTGLHKRRLTLAELAGPLAAVLDAAKTPAPFDLPTLTGTSDQAAADWTDAAAAVEKEAEAKAARRADGFGPTLTRSTLAFIREGAASGDRHRLLFSAAANLGELNCPHRLAEALLEESALDSGLAPKDVRRGIECGLRAGWTGQADESTQRDASGTPQGTPDDSTVKEPLERNTGDSRGSDGQTCQQVTGATDTKPAGDLQAELARLWGSTPAPKADQAGAVPQSPTPALDAQGFDWATGRQGTPAASPSLSLPPPLVPLPPGAVGSGTLDKPCRCGSTEYAEMPISEGRTRRDCRKCGRFVGWGKWHDQGGPTP